MRTRALLVVLAVTAVLAGAGCTDDAPGSGGLPADTTSRPPPEPADPPAPFRAADPRLPVGWTRAQCADLTARGNTGLVVRLAVPPAFVPTESDGRRCSFVRAFARELTISFGPGPTLGSVKARDVDPYTPSGQGDGQLGEVSYAADVPVYGDHRGERLDYFCFCDGQNLQERTVLARGVRVSWTTPHGKDSRDDLFDQVTASVALVRGRTSTCAGHGRTATYRPPVPQTESVDSFQGRCHLYLRPGRGSLQRYAEVVPVPRRSLDDLAAALRRLKRVHDVRLERGVAVLDGRPADRLTWRHTRDKVSLYNDPAGTWRLVALGTPDLRVTWGARPGQWRREADVVSRFVGSVHLLP
ncbi:hypothetical protein GON03_15095 [Nocardioides sp. MAH-18]|uniref:DUF3558 domain-containing protein n=1 Tax=Nocardioides agri TaxID=2682843 RepID=A0A6L6XUR8_9ACTN|nr:MULTISPECIES: hypothetical protein [unclassified Nocardioides]MBA2955662.1 hypothetical protein [Nocardioides sp. CGMCC 1.13656]MVQ50512.1 hypothetical protein [Nocardioides sp. MAH-18]